MTEAAEALPQRPALTRPPAAAARMSLVAESAGPTAPFAPRPVRQTRGRLGWIAASFADPR
jgi:hypothetical protein